MSKLLNRRGYLEGAYSVKDEPSAGEVVIQETGNPRALVNLVPPKLAELILALPPQLLGCDEDVLIRKANPVQLDEMLRLSFWDEYSAAIDAARNMKLANVYGRICSKDYFYKDVITVPTRLAFMIRPTVEYTFKMRDLLELGHRRMREILKLPVVRDGKPDSKLIAEMVKIVALVENRVRGAVVQKVQMEQKSLNVNVAATPKTYYEINDELLALEKEIKRLEVGSGGGVSELEVNQVKTLKEAEVRVTTEETRVEREFAAPLRPEVLSVAEGVLRVQEPDESYLFGESDREEFDSNS